MTAEQAEAKRAYNRGWHAAHRMEANETSRAWREAHPDETRAHNRAYYLAHRAEGIEHQRVWNAAHPYRGMTDEQRERHRLTAADQRRRHPERVAGRVALTAAVRGGAIVRGPCAECGGPQTEGHHHAGYARENWLIVTWLCRKHHKEVHRIDVAALVAA